ncbi:Stk1 family PASTA domain-containing Ser/Thr kinase [Bacillus sp. V3B]|uniref:Stk1 family PASTA domain-containing Ser/Thr kinase n=1 Tax=Bacillus sp. V3B TaxID=2804915 RepID=UPI00210E2288|nr:Stk1 family PASTA domain-containing Ser/Thr kinase [Bacillus sp. V3B]MCQ6274047.1 Stk1 family PASTA domain-containing Ser/Thr kinase [Bacillus sp. V3B]
MMIGKRLSGRYKILEMVGGGGMANVYLAHDMILDRDVAVKVLRLDFANNEEFIRRFHREAQSATSLAHPNIVNIYDVGDEDDSIYYIVMEYIDGQTLKEYIQKRSPVPIEDALTVMQQLTSAISHAHHNHIIHRDIKPQNILVDPNGTVKITDFGIAMALSATSITQTNSVLGSVHYLSPEQARGGVANHTSDIYSLGIVMFELLTGRLPFSGESAVSIALKHLQSETPSLRRWNPSIPQSVENIVLKATAKDPFHRYASVEEMEADIRTALDPDRLDEPKFTIALDDEATKAIPVITDDQLYSNHDETIIHGKEKKTKSASTSLKQEEKGKSKKKRKKLPIILFSILSVLIILVILFFTVFPALFLPKDIEVPDVSNMALDKAISELVTAGFFIGDTKEVSHEEIEEGYVVKTEPKAGRMAKEGAEINIFESTGKATFKLLKYTDSRYEDVVTRLNDKGFKDIKKIEVHDDEADVGMILEQNYREGDEVIPDETVLEFTVSKGPALIEVKDLSGFNAAGVQEYADSVGLQADVAEKQYSKTVPKDTVMSQNPAAGTSVKKGSKIKVIISKGPQQLPPKTVTEVVKVLYEPLVEGAQQEVQIFIEDFNEDMMEPYVTEYITEDWELPVELTIAPGEFAVIRVIRDDKVILDKSFHFPE